MSLRSGVRSTCAHGDSGLQWGRLHAECRAGSPDTRDGRVATGLLPLTRVPAAALLVTWPHTRVSLSVAHTAPLCVMCAVCCLSVPPGRGAPRGQESCLLVEPADSALVSSTPVPCDREWV